MPAVTQCEQCLTGRVGIAGAIFGLRPSAILALSLEQIAQCGFPLRLRAFDPDQAEQPEYAVFMIDGRLGFQPMPGARQGGFVGRGVVHSVSSQSSRSYRSRREFTGLDWRPDGCRPASVGTLPEAQQTHQCVGGFIGRKILRVQRHEDVASGGRDSARHGDSFQCQFARGSEVAHQRGKFFPRQSFVHGNPVRRASRTVMAVCRL